MSPVEDDPNAWSYALKMLQTLKDSLAFVVPFLAPAFIGGVLRAMRKDARKKGWAYWLNVVSWSTAAGALLTPLFVHFAGVPESVSGSVACLIGILGKDAVDYFRDKLSLKKSD